MWSSFSSHLKLNEEVPSIITNVFKFDKITKVQHIVINEFIKNQDVIVKSVTGSGKTLSYVIPLIQRLIVHAESNPDYTNHILAIILLPSRELSVQVYNDIIKFTNNLNNFKFTAQLLIGGKKVEDDIQKIKLNMPNIIVATPGRWWDIEEKEDFRYSNLQVLIMDEADKMLDMGFEVAVSQIWSKLPKQRRTGWFSATVTSNVENIIKAGMRNPVFIDINVLGNNDIFINEHDISAKVGTYGKYYKILPFTFDNDKISNSSQEVPKGLNQYYRIVQNIKYKIPHLIQILSGLYNSEGSKKIMIFVSTCNSVDYFAILLPELFKRLGFIDTAISKLHSKISQNKREKEYKHFRNTESIEENANQPQKTKWNILLTTDLAARGIDVPDVDMIIQFDPPKTEDSYIHKAGRTARVGHSGVSLWFLTETENTFITYMKQKLINIENFPSIYLNEEDNRHINSVDILSAIKEINWSDKWIYDKAVNAFISYLRFYKEIEWKYIFDFRSLDIGNLANSLQWIKMPRIKMKEFTSESVKNFIEDTLVKPVELKYKSKNIEKQMAVKQEKIYEKWNEIRQRKEEQKELKTLNRIKETKNKGENHNRTRKEKKEAKINAMISQWDDWADDDKLYKKYKKGKITKEEYEKFLLKTK